MAVEAADHDVRALDEPKLAGRGAAELAEHVIDPGTGGVDEDPRFERRTRAGPLVLGRQRPAGGSSLGRDRLRPRADRGAAIGCVARVQRDEPRVVDPAIRVFEGVAPKRSLERLARSVGREIERAGRRQKLASAEVIVEEKS